MQKVENICPSMSSVKVSPVNLISRDFAFNDREVLSIREPAFHFRAIEIPVGLRARRLNGRTAASIEQAELNSGRVDDLAHDSAKRIDFVDEVAFRNPANCRIATHLAN